MAMFNNERLNWPTNGDINAWADFVETVCILTEDGLLTIDWFTDFLSDDATKSTGDILKAINFNEQFLAPLAVATTMPINPIDALGEEDHFNEDDEDEENFDGDDEENERKEVIQSRLILLFNFIESRKRYFALFYPFNIVNSTLKLIDEQTRLQQLYQVLLFSSEMHLYLPGDINRLGHLFEALCERPFKQTIPAIAEKRFFGAGGGQIIQSDYQGNLRQKITQLAFDLNVPVNPIINDPDELGPTGDAGLDWVGWLSYEDTCDHQPLYFGQCACGTNWVDKQNETSLSRWRNFLQINQSVQCIHFMPKSFRRNSLDWFRKSAIHQELTLIDRFRMLKMFALENDTIIDEVLMPYEDILFEAKEFSL